MPNGGPYGRDYQPYERAEAREVRRMLTELCDEVVGDMPTSIDLKRLHGVEGLPEWYISNVLMRREEERERQREETRQRGGNYHARRERALAKLTPEEVAALTRRR